MHVSVVEEVLFGYFYSILKQKQQFKYSTLLTTSKSPAFCILITCFVCKIFTWKVRSRPNYCCVNVVLYNRQYFPLKCNVYAINWRYSSTRTSELYFSKCTLLIKTVQNEPVCFTAALRWNTRYSLHLCRFGPRQIRTESAMLRAYSGTGAAPYESLMVADIGDVNVNVYDLKDTCKRIRETYRKILATGCIPLTMGERGTCLQNSFHLRDSQESRARSVNDL